jgi:hypothetical protein
MLYGRTCPDSLLSRRQSRSPLQEDQFVDQSMKKRLGNVGSEVDEEASAAGQFATSLASAFLICRRAASSPLPELAHMKCTTIRKYRVVSSLIFHCSTALIAAHEEEEEEEKCEPIWPR